MFVAGIKVRTISVYIKPDSMESKNSIISFSVRIFVKYKSIVNLKRKTYTENHREPQRITEVTQSYSD
jgi:hypothetical protein